MQKSEHEKLPHLSYVHRREPLLPPLDHGAPAQHEVQWPSSVMARVEDRIVEDPPRVVHGDIVAFPHCARLRRRRLQDRFLHSDVGWNSTEQERGSSRIDSPRFCDVLDLI